MEPWTPAIASPELWFDAADSATLELDGSAVSAWSDKSGYGRSVSNTGAARPTLMPAGLAGLPVLSFDGGDALRNLTTMPGLLENVGQAMAFVVRKYPAAQTVPRMSLCIRGGSPGNTRLGVEAGRTANKAEVGWRRGDALSYERSTPDGSMDDQWHIQCAVADWVAATLSQYMDGALESTTTPISPPGTIARVASMGVIVGGNPSGTADLMLGEIAEIVLVHSVDSELRQRIEGYLAHKWGLAGGLPAEHPYKATAPFMGQVSGVVTDTSGAPSARLVRAYNRSTGRLVAETTSDETTGAYSIDVPDGEVQVVVLDDDAGDLHNDIIMRVLPE